MAKSKDKLANLAIELSLQNEQFIKAIGASTKRLEQINQGTKKAAKSLNVMERGFQAITIAAAAFYTVTRGFDFAKGLVQAEESILNLEASFSALLGSAERGADMLGRVYGIVEATGVSFDSAAKSVQRLAIGLNEIGASNEQIAKIAENFVKLGRISGTSLEDINGALLQFTQGLASGRLQGDELRSIFERLPQVIQLIAKEMNITTGEVRKMGAEGKITADIMANALLGATEDINAAFQTLEVTVEQTFNKMAAKWQVTAAIISQSLGFGDAFQGFYEGLGNLAEGTANFFIKLRNTFVETIQFFARGIESVIRIFDTSTADELLKKIEKVDEKTKEFNKSIEKLREVTKAINTDTATLIETVDNTTESFTALQDAMFDYQEKVIKASESTIPFEEKLNILNNLFEQGIINQKTYQDELNKLSKTTKEVFADDTALLEYKETLSELSALWRQGMISLEQYSEAAQKALEKLNKTQKETTDDMLEQMQRLAADGVSDLVDVIVDADRSFSEFAENFLRQIAKMIIQQQVLNALKGTSIGGFFGFAQGSAFASPTGLPQGVYNQPTFFPMPESNGLTAFAKGGTFGTGVMAEAGAEAIVPLRRGMNGDLGVQSSPVNVIVNNTMSESADVYAEATTKEDGSKQIEIMVERKVKESLGNGALDKSFSTNYGLKRRAM